jgi:hypothetical protein
MRGREADPLPAVPYVVAGTLSWSIQILFHHIESVRPTGKRDQARFEMTYTKDMVRVSLLKKSGSD